jgi:tyrosinase
MDMKHIRTHWALSGLLCLFWILGAGACTNENGVTPVHEQLCKATHEGAGSSGGYAVPGEAGAPRWGIPATPPTTRRVRRSWSSLSDSEKKKVVDAFIALKHITTTSGDPGSARANYTSFCDELGLQSYERNLYDFYVEAHVNAYLSMMTPQEGMSQMAHMAPQFLAWHRYLLLRLEADLGEAIGDPNFALPYWDWTDCYADGDPKTCAPLFAQSYLGTAGGCDDASSSVEGYLTDQGFHTNIYTEGQEIFSTSSVRCGQRAIQRKVGCLDNVNGPPDSAAINGIFDRVVYDDAPYDSCHTEEDISFRQYLEGFSNDDTDPICVAAGCGMHGRGHVFIGGDMQASTASPNDPVFFLHHAEVDRMWAAWQENNLQSGDAARTVDHGNPGFPDSYRGPLFNFSEVNASDMFDYKALGYEYDSLPTKQ